jgi:hypothetical protein
MYGRMTLGTKRPLGALSVKNKNPAKNENGPAALAHVKVSCIPKIVSPAGFHFMSHFFKMAKKGIYDPF